MGFVCIHCSEQTIPYMWKGSKVRQAYQPHVSGQRMANSLEDKKSLPGEKANSPVMNVVKSPILFSCSLGRIGEIAGPAHRYLLGRR